MNDDILSRVKTPEHTAKSYDLIAQRYADQWFTKPATLIIDRFIGYVVSPSLVLDVGCGPGGYSYYMVSHGIRIIGIDMSRNMLNEASERCGFNKFARMNMLNMGINTDVFDGLWVCASFLHIPKRDAPVVLKELRRALRPGGVLFISVKRGRDERWIAHGSGHQRFFAFYQEDELDRLLAAAGFAVREGWLDADPLGRPEPWIVRLAE